MKKFEEMKLWWIQYQEYLHENFVPVQSVKKHEELEILKEKLVTKRKVPPEYASL